MSNDETTPTTDEAASSLIPTASLAIGTTIDPAIDGDYRRLSERGLRFGHVVMTRTQDAIREQGAQLEALTELLIARGVLRYRDLEERKAALLADAEQPEVRARIGAEVDKYGDTFETISIDCDARRPLCKAACCRMPFLLTRQDLDEGIVRWDYGQPYVIRHREDGWCVHNDVTARGCTVHANRPAVCRAYDCRNDPRVWVDFERRIPNPALADLG